MRRENCICLWIYNDDDDDAFEMWQHKLRNIYSNKTEWMNLIEMHIFAFFWYVSIVYITVLINMSHAIMNEWMQTFCRLFLSHSLMSCKCKFTFIRVHSEHICISQYIHLLFRKSIVPFLTSEIIISFLSISI